MHYFVLVLCVEGQLQWPLRQFNFVSPSWHFQFRIRELKNTIFLNVSRFHPVPQLTMYIGYWRSWPDSSFDKQKNNVSDGFRKPCFSSVVIVFVMWVVSNNHHMDGSIPGSRVACATVTLSTDNSHTVPTCPPGSSEIAEHGKSQFLLRFGDESYRGYGKKTLCLRSHSFEKQPMDAHMNSWNFVF